MALYSHSKLSTFEQCKYKYKLRYIDKIPSPVEKSIEAHVGTCTHDTLEWLYKKVLLGTIPTIEEILQKYISKWEEDYTESIVIVKEELNLEHYFNLGIKHLLNYYKKHHPFEDGTIEMEKKVFIELDETFPHKIIGYIDRLVYNKEKKRFEIHDYKTANFLPPQEKFDEDRQLALYSLAIKQLYGKEKPVLLTWHYLNHDIQIYSTRSNEQLEKLKQDTIKLIKEIENTKEFPATKSKLCDWCEYKQYCGAHGNSLPKKFDEKQKTIGEILENEKR